MPDRVTRRRGQAAVELLAALPALVLAVLVGLGMIALAHEWVAAAGAARAGGRAALVRAPVDAAAGAILGPRAGARARVAVDPTSGVVRVETVPPRALRPIAPRRLVAASVHRAR